MAIIRFDEFEGDTIVLHFGGAEGSIDAYTLSEALAGFADTARAVSFAIDPETEIEIIVEATGPGSYRTVVRKVKKGFKGLMAGAMGAVLWNIISNIIYDGTLKSDPKMEIVVNTNEVVIKHGNDTIVVPRAVYDSAQNAKKNPAVQRGITKTFRALENDDKITDFGMTKKIDDPQPLIRIPRAEFPLIATPVVVLDEQPKERTRTERVRLIILKAWLNSAKRKWSFEWNGIPISAPVADKDFLARVKRREHLFGNGDALDVELAFTQVFNEELNMYVNDQGSFVITRIIRPVPRG